MKHYIATFNGVDDPYDTNGTNSPVGKTLLVREAAENAVRKSGVKTKRSNPTAVNVAVSSLTIKNGQLQRNKLGDISVMPPLERMTQEEFGTEQDNLLKTMPVELHDFLRSYAWDQGHSSGYEEVINILEELVTRMKPGLWRMMQRTKA